MIEIKLLKEEYLDKLVNIWLKTIGKDWVPEIKYEEAIERFKQHIGNNPLPLTYLALENDIPVGMASLRKDSAISSELTPWIGSVCVNPEHHKKGIATLLINKIKNTAKKLGYKKIHLFILDQTLETFYNKFNFKTFEEKEYKRFKALIMKASL